jgi:hypothetical protein
VSPATFKAAGMNSLELLRTAEEKMNNTLLAYTEGSRRDSALRQNLIEDLKKATTEFLELRRQFSLGLGQVMLTN